MSAQSPGDVQILSEVAQHPSLARAVAAARELLGLDIAFTGRIAGGIQAYEQVDGEGFGIVAGESVPYDVTYCQRILAGELPAVIADTSAIPAGTVTVPAGATRFGAFVSVPIILSDGELYGTLCGGTRDARPDFDERDEMFMQVLSRMVADALERDRLEARARAAEMRADASSTLLAAIATRDQYTGEHSGAVVGLCRSVAAAMDLDEETTDEVEQVARLHDIGKIGIPDAVLHKPGPLDDGEWEVMKTHPARGAQLLAAVPALAPLAPAVRAEHERWDGRGYPDGLAGEEIPLASRITFAADAYHAMTSDRPYRNALSAGEARRELAEHAGTQFCPHSVRVLLAVLDSAG